MNMSEAQDNIPLPPEDNPEKALEAGEPSDPYDTSSEEQSLEQLLAELEATQASIDENFAQYATERIENTPELDEMYFNNKSEFVQTLLKLQQEFLEKEVSSRAQKVSELNESIANKRAGGEYQKAKNAFLQEFPEENPDELIAFAQEGLPPKVLNELKELSPLEFLKAVKQIKDNGGVSGGAGAKNALPQAIDGQAGDALSGGLASSAPKSVFNRP